MLSRFGRFFQQTARLTAESLAIGGFAYAASSVTCLNKTPKDPKGSPDPIVSDSTSTNPPTPAMKRL